MAASTPSTPRCGFSNGDTITRQLFSPGPVNDEITTSSENIKVYLRIRPQTSTEQNDPVAISKVADNAIEVAGSTSVPGGRYWFDHVFDEKCSQNEVFETTARNLVHGLFNGTSSLVFAYGVTNAGKTYTVHGVENDEGLLPRLVRSLFNSIRLLEQGDPMEVDCDKEFSSRASMEALQKPDKQGSLTVFLSCLEVYNEKLTDLLSPRRKELRMIEDNGDMVVKGLVEMEVPNVDEALNQLKAAKRRIQMGQTHLNADSSRSHSAFCLHLCRTIKEGQFDVLGRIIVCDLAGSERAGRTFNAGTRLKEAANINQSLVVLGRCLETLRWNQNHPTHQRRVVPYRESKITRLFQSTLGGNGKTVMLVNISPCMKDLDETVHALKYSSIAKEILNTPAAGPKAQLRRINTITNLSTDNTECSNRSKEFEIRGSLSNSWVESIQKLQSQFLDTQMEITQFAETSFQKQLRLQESVYEKKIAEFREEINKMRSLLNTSMNVPSETEIEDEPTTLWKFKHNSEIDKNRAELTTQLSQQTQKVISLQKELDSNKVQSAKNSEAQTTKILGLQQNLQTLEQTIGLLKTEAEEGRFCQIRLERLNQEMEAKENEWKAKSKEWEKKLNDSSKTNQTLREKLRNMEQELEKEEGIHYNQKQTINSLTTANQHAASTIQAQQQLTEQQRKDLQKYREALREAEKQVSQQTQELEANRTRCRQLEAERESLMSMVNELKKNYVELEQEHKKLQHQYDELRALKEEKEHQLSLLEVQCREFQKQLNNTSEGSRIGVITSVLEQERAAIHRQNQELKQIRQQLDLEHELIAKEKANLENERQSIRSISSQESNVKIKEEPSIFMAKSQQLQASNQCLLEANRGLCLENRDLHNQISQLQEQSMQLHQQIEKYKQEKCQIEHIQAERCALETEKLRFKLQVEEWQKQQAPNWMETNSAAQSLNKTNQNNDTREQSSQLFHMSVDLTPASSPLMTTPKISDEHYISPIAGQWRQLHTGELTSPELMKNRKRNSQQIEETEIYDNYEKPKQRRKDIIDETCFTPPDHKPTPGGRHTRLRKTGSRATKVRIGDIFVEDLSFTQNDGTDDVTIITPKSETNPKTYSPIARRLRRRTVLQLGDN